MARSKIVAGVLAVVLVVAVGLTAWGQWWLHDQDSRAATSAAARSAAEDAVTSVLSYDYRSLKAQMASTASLLTGDARTQYDDLATPLLESAPKLKAVMQASVKSSAVLDDDGDEVDVLLVVDQTSSSTQLDAPQVDQSRIVVTMVRQDGDWLVSTLNAV